MDDAKEVVIRVMEEEERNITDWAPLSSMSEAHCVTFCMSAPNVNR